MGIRMKTTRKQIEQNYYCIAVGYCQLQHLLTYANSPYYTTGIYGWNFDVYTFEYKGCNVAICTGYRGMTGVRVAYDIEHDFEKRADAILTDNIQGNKRERLDALIQEFISVALPDIK